MKINDAELVPTTFLIRKSKLTRLKSICVLQNQSMAEALRKMIDAYVACYDIESGQLFERGRNNLCQETNKTNKTSEI